MQSGRSPGVRNGNPLQRFLPEKSKGRGAWRGLQSNELQRIWHDWVDWSTWRNSEVRRLTLLLSYRVGIYVCFFSRKSMLTIFYMWLELWRPEYNVMNTHSSKADSTATISDIQPIRSTNVTVKFPKKRNMLKGFSRTFRWICYVLVAQSWSYLFAIPWLIVSQASLKHGISGKNTGVGWHFLLQGDFPPNPGVELRVSYCRHSLSAYNVSQ